MAYTDDYINLIAPACQEAASRYGVWASVAIGQSILETGWGKSPLAERNNMFGVKWHHNPAGPFPEHVTGVYLHRTTERPDSGEYVTDAYFRTYASPLGSALDYADNLRTNPAYARTGAFEATTADDFARRIGPTYTGGDSTYAGKVIDLMNRYNLRTYDTKEATPMATPLTPDRMLTALRNEGCTVREYPGWRTRGIARARQRGHNVHGVVIHHTAGDAWSTAEEYIQTVLIAAGSAVPDKCHAAIDKDGTVWLVTAGRANHMAYYGQRALDASLAGTWPLTGSVNYRGSLQNGNQWTYGVECIAKGVPNSKQRESAVRWAAAICRAHGWKGGEVFGHGEASSDRGFSDPGWDMGAFRRDVQARLRGTTTPTTPPAVSGWDGKPIKGGHIGTPYGRRGKSWSINRNAAGEGIHTGDDWPAAVGTAVYAVADGTVTIADGGDLGLMSILRGDNGRFYRYCHLRKGSRDPWNGQRVKAGQKIAEVGLTGKVFGAHLHIEDTTSAQIWPPVGHRKPSWPLPQQPSQPPTPIEEDPVPDLHTTRTTYQHPGPTADDPDSGYLRIINDDGEPVPAVPVPALYDTEAQIHAPTGVKIKWRYAQFDEDWLRTMEVITPKTTEGHPTHVAASGKGQCVAPLFLDIWASQPCEITVEQQTLYWPKG